MTSLVKLLVVVLLALQAGHVLADDWKLAARAEDQSVSIYYNPNNIFRYKSTAEVWMMEDFKNPQNRQQGQSYLSGQYIVRFDCVRMTAQYTNSNLYSKNMGTGSIVFTATFGANAPSGAPFRIPRDSKFEGAFTAVCK